MPKSTRPFVLIFPAHQVVADATTNEETIIYARELDYESFIDKEAAGTRFTALVKVLGRSQVIVTRALPEAAEIDDKPRVTFGAPRKRRASTTEPAKRKPGRPAGARNKPKTVVVVDDEVMA